MVLQEDRAAGVDAIAERGGECEASRVRDERGEAKEREVARPRDAVHNPFRCRMELGRRLPKTMMPPPPSFLDFDWDEAATDEGVGGGGGDSAGGRPLRPLAEEAATQRVGSDGSKSVQGIKEREEEKVWAPRMASRLWLAKFVSEGASLAN
uniref:Uncharacterized protein n=1 Tax=Oryza barthii TaxID=65489 RepID=A0A0D3H6X0_9ORYZ